MRPLVVICGPTATGKSALAIALAERFNFLLISADSRQIYRDFDIGTAKPTVAEQARWPHHLIDCADPRQTYTVANYQQAVTELITATPGQTPLLVGGTGLYLQAITEGLGIPAIAPQPQLRQQLASLGQAHAYDLLNTVEPEHRIHANDAVRTLRALEVFYVTGQPASRLRSRCDTKLPYRVLMLGLRPASLDELEARIAHRTEQMLAAGWLSELEALQARYGDTLPLLSTLGYAELRQYQRGEVSLAAAKALIICHTRQFAKRQLTWFRRVPNMTWYDATASDLLPQVSAAVAAFLTKIPTEHPEF